MVAASPVRYALPPSISKKALAVLSGLLIYPFETLGPIMISSPSSPFGTTSFFELTTTIFVSAFE